MPRSPSSAAAAANFQRTTAIVNVVLSRASAATPHYMSTEDNATAPPPPTAAPGQTAAVKEIMSKVINLHSTTKYARQNAMFAIFAAIPLNCEMSSWSRGLLKKSACWQPNT